MIEFYTVLAVFVLFMVIRAVRRRGTPAAGTAAGGGTPRWYQKVSPGTGLIVALWLIGIALVWLIANKYWRIETGVVWGEWSSSRENLWVTILSLALLAGTIARAILFRREQAGSTSEYGTRGGRSRFSLGAAVWTFVGLALFGLLVLKTWHEFEFGLSNAPERMALRGYVPQERLAAALAAAAPALPEVHTITAPPLGADGTTNWSDSVIRESDYHNLYFNIPDDAEPFVVKRADGAVTNFCAATRAKEIEFCSLTNAVTIKWWQSKRKLTPQEIAVLEEN